MTERQKWEYEALLFKGDLVAGLNKAGADGWEFCEIIERATNDKGQVVAHGVIMKRPAQLIVTDLASAPTDLKRPSGLTA